MPLLPYDSNFLIDLTLDKLDTNINETADGKYDDHYSHVLDRYAPFEAGIMNVSVQMEEIGINQNIVKLTFASTVYNQYTTQNGSVPGFNSKKMMRSSGTPYKVGSGGGEQSWPQGTIMDVDLINKPILGEFKLDGVVETVLTETYSTEHVSTTMEVIRNLFTPASVSASRNSAESKINDKINDLLVGLNGTHVWVRLEGGATEIAATSAEWSILKFYKAATCLPTDELSLSNTDYLGDGLTATSNNGSDSQLFAEWLCHHKDVIDKKTEENSPDTHTFMEEIVNCFGNATYYASATSDVVVAGGDIVLDDAGAAMHGRPTMIQIDDMCMGDKLSIRVKVHIENVQSETWYKGPLIGAPSAENTRSEFGAYVTMTGLNQIEFEQSAFNHVRGDLLALSNDWTTKYNDWHDLDDATTVAFNLREDIDDEDSDEWATRDGVYQTAKTASDNANGIRNTAKTAFNTKWIDPIVIAIMETSNVAVDVPVTAANIFVPGGAMANEFAGVPSWASVHGSIVHMAGTQAVARLEAGAMILPLD